MAQAQPTQSVLSERRLPVLWVNAGFMLMWTSVAASGFGDRMIMLAAEHLLGINAESAQGAGSAGVAINIAASVQFAFFVPYLLFTLVGGWLADRLPRKWIMLACDEARALILLVAWVMAADYMSRSNNGLDPNRAIADAAQWKIYIIMAATGAFAAIFNPSKFATLPQIVRRDDIQPANAVLASIALIASLIGLTLGWYVKQDLRGGILIGVLCYAISGTFFAFLRPVRHEVVEVVKKPGIGQQVVAALSYMRGHKVVRNLVLLNILFWAAAWIVSAAVVGLTKGYYGIPSADFFDKKNILLAMFGGGTLCGSIVLVFVRERRVSGLVAMLALLLAAICMFGLAINRIYEFGMVLGFLAGFFGGVFLISIDSLTQSLTPNYIRGRVFGLRSMLNTVGTVVVNFVIWRLPGDDADQIVIWGLGIMAAGLLFLAVYSSYTQLASGPMPDRMTNALWRLIRLIALVWHRVKWTGRHHVPGTGPVILAPNHTAGSDPFLIQACLGRRVRYLMLRSYQFPILNVLWRCANPILVDQEGKDMAAVRQIIRALKDGDIVGVYPEGGLQRTHRNLQEFASGIGLIAKKSQAAVIPTWVYGTPQAKWMVWHFIKPSRSRIAFGEPYFADPKQSNEQVTAEIRRRMMALAVEVARVCPGCSCDLKGTLESGGGQCPQCGAEIVPRPQPSDEPD